MKHATEFVCLAQKRRLFSIGQKFDPCGQFDVSFQFQQRTARDAQEADVGSTCASAISFGDIGWDGNGGAPGLRDQAEDFFSRKIRVA